MPAAMVTAIEYAANFYDAWFTNPITVNIAVGYGEVGGVTLASNRAARKAVSTMFRLATAPCSRYSAHRMAGRFCHQQTRPAALGSMFRTRKPRRLG